MNNVHSGLAPAARADCNNLPDDRWKRRTLRKAHQFAPTRLAPDIPTALDRERPASYAVTFEPKPRRSLLARFINWIMRSYP